jgi:hypothetical protein
LALDQLPSGAELCSQSTISRLENLPDMRALLRLARVFVEQYCVLIPGEVARESGMMSPANPI